MKRNYELTVVFTPVLKEKGLSTAISEVENLIKKFKGKVQEVTDEGKQRLAYPIEKYKEGIYVFWKIQMPGENVNKFESQLLIQKGILRQLLIVTKG
jgi:small subunit ribosomal protein S6